MTLVRVASESERPLLHRIDQFYLYEFSAYLPEYYRLDAEGVFQDGDYVDYWADPNKTPYLILEGEELAGFALVSRTGPRFNLDQFFVMLKFQGRGTASRAATSVLDAHRGDWELHSLKTNAKSERFWPKFLAAYASNGHKRSSLPPKHTHYAYTFSNE